MLLLALLLLGGCEQRVVPAVGSYSDVYVFTETGRYDPLLREFAQSITHPIRYAFEEENEFNVFLREASLLSGNRDRKNIVLVMRTDRAGSLLSQARDLLGEGILERAREEGHLVLRREDLFARGQDVYFVLMQGRAEEEYVLQRLGPKIRGMLRESTQRRYRDFLLKGRENRGGAQYLWRQYGFTIRYPKEYHLLQERADLQAVELHRTDPSRSLGIFWMGDVRGAPSLADSLSLLAFRARVGERLYGDTILGGDYRFEESQLGVHPAILMRGIWQNEEDVTGGPFLTYFVYDVSRHRLWAVDLLLYAPGLEKHPYMRELEALGSTFHF